MRRFAPTVVARKSSKRPKQNHRNKLDPNFAQFELKVRNARRETYEEYTLCPSPEKSCEESAHRPVATARHSEAVPLKSCFQKNCFEIKRFSP